MKVNFLSHNVPESPVLHCPPLDRPLILFFWGGYWGRDKGIGLQTCGNYRSGSWRPRAESMCVEGAGPGQRAGRRPPSSRDLSLFLLRSSVGQIKRLTWWRGFPFAHSLLILVLIPSKNTFTATSGLVFDQTSGHHRLAKLMHKINHHRR